MNRQFGPGWTPGSFLASLPPDKCAELLASGVRRQFGAGRPLLREGELSTHVEVLIRGFVKVTNVLDGVEVLMAIRMPGDILGEMAALTGRPRMATVTTCGRVTSCVLSKGEFRRFLRENPAAALNMAAALGERLRWSNQRRSDFAAYPAEVRLARLLVEIATTCGRQTDDGLSLGVPLSQPELATMIGVAEATVQKAFRELRECGVIRTGYRQITVVDVPALRVLGDGAEDVRSLTA
ncbi:Crp/Fnr family transcriptional regulator [Phytohabitans rumicis]|uniref:Crp/Fnr family transcriptional regulator n=1 Tax=Phytohabitans rumicis TaxID=1076125 RepID=UPI0031EE314B